MNVHGLVSSKWPNLASSCTGQIGGSSVDRLEVEGNSRLRRRRQDESRLHLYAPPPPPRAGPPPGAAASRSKMTGCSLSQVEKEMEGINSQPKVLSPSMEMAVYNSSKLQMEVKGEKPKEHDIIKISLDEEMEVEFQGFTGIVIGLHLSSKMAVSFPPNSDRFVQFELRKIFDLELNSHPYIDKDLLRTLWHVKPKSTEEPFRTGPDDILKWNQSVFVYPPAPMLKVTADANPSVKESEGLVFSVLGVPYTYTGQSPLQDLVITVPLPRVDESGQPRRVVKTYIWHNVGTHVERADSIEWHLGSINDSNHRGDLSVNYYHNGGTYDMSQFFPVNASFSYTNCRALEVVRARGAEGLLDFVMSKTGHGRCTVFDPRVMQHRAAEAKQRAAEAEAAALAWQQLPWDNEGGNVWEVY
ncbi:coatomer subunit delta-1-like isoform X1 [Hordeum vulgare subsp. vulgare]|nr:coatomer subunit delta-1-like isoform X1 [Hordeum vulgare subsp. vulgare]